MISYNEEAYEQFLKINVPIYTDRDEWDKYECVKKDPVLHVDVLSGTVCDE
jgi:hypothetical protein